MHELMIQCETIYAHPKVLSISRARIIRDENMQELFSRVATRNKLKHSHYPWSRIREEELALGQQHFQIGGYGV